MGFGGNLFQIAARGWTFLFTLLAMSLVGNAIAIQLRSNSSVNFAMFVTTIAMLTLIIFLVSRFAGLPAMVMVVLDAVSMLFSLIAGIVLAARLHVHSCNSVEYLLTNQLTQGMEQRCRELQASTAFFWFMWLGFLASLLLGIGESGSISSTSSFRGSRKTASTPAMSQV